MGDGMSTVDFLATVPGFDALSGEDLERLASSSAILQFNNGDYLMRKGSEGDIMHVVREGRVRVPVFDQTGRLRVMAVVEEGEIVGEMALLTGDRRNADVIADGPTKTIAFARETILPLLGDHPPLARFLTEILGSRLESSGGIEQVGKYRLLGKIGEGATAKVYEAIHPGLNRTVAIKMLGHELVYDKNFRERFLDEARTIAGLGHPNIVQVFDTEQAYATCFVVMERLEGTNLLDYLKENAPVEPVKACSILSQVGEALAYAHRHGIVHRDVKPANIAIDEDGGVKLMDFGIAARSASSVGRMSGIVEGTPRYIAPEAALGHMVDGRADIYALGVVAFEMVTGQPLFKATSVAEYVQAHATRTPPDIAKVARGLPDGLVKFIQGSLKKKPAERLGDWNEIRGLLGGTDSAAAAMALLEERVIRVRYRPEARGRVDKMVAGLRRSVGALPDGDVAEALLASPKAAADSSAAAGGKATGWFAKITGKTDPNISATRSFEIADDT